MADGARTGGARAGGLGRRPVLAAAALAALPAAPARAGPPAEAAVEVAPGLHVLPGRHREDASDANANAIANLAFVVGGRSVAVLDPGGSLRHGRLLRAAIGRATGLPISHLVLSHAHPDHVMGATAFADCGAEVVGHAALAAQLAAREPFYRAMLAREMPGEAAGGPLPVTRAVAEGQGAEIDLGGRVLELRAHPAAHSPCDLTALDRATGTLWLADLLFLERCPSFEGSLRGWIALLEALRAEPAARAVPGHGPAAVAWPAGGADLAAYLAALRDGTRAAIAAGVDIAEAPGRVAAAESLRWALAGAYHGRNVTGAYRELEWE